MSMDTVKGGGSVERTLKLHQTLNTFPNVNSKILSIDSGQKNKPDIPEKEITQLPLLVRILKPSNYFNSILKKFLRPIDFFYKVKIKQGFRIEKYEGNFSALR